MFGKLLKHELKATAPLMLLMNGTALLVALTFWGAVELSRSLPWLEWFPNIADFGDEGTAIFLLAILAVGFILIMCTFHFGTNLLLLFPFYKRRFTRRGYLTFSLPTTASKDFFAALTVILFWNVVVFFVLYLIMAIFFMANGDSPSSAWLYYTDIYVLTPSKCLDADEWFNILSVVSVFLYRTVAGMTAVVIAGNYLRRTKAVGTIAIYWAFRLPVIAFMLLTDVGRNIGHVSMDVVLDSFPSAVLISAYSTDLYPIYSIVLLVLTVICCFLSIHILKKRLNLE